MKTLENLDLQGKTVLLRANLNVPLENGRIIDDFRIKAVLPTINYLQKNARKTVICAHLGRPKSNDSALSLRPIAQYLEKIYREDFQFLDDCVGENVKMAIDSAADGSIVLLENLRFHSGEAANDEQFGRELASLADIYVNDAIGDSYKEYASVMWPPRFLPSAAGFRLLEEVKQLDHLMKSNSHPFVMVIGGAKITEKLGVIRALGEKVDKILLGGGVANTFLAAQGHDLGSSLIHPEEIPLAKELLQHFSDKLVLPIELIAAEEGGNKEFVSSTIRSTSIGDLRKGEGVLDIGVSALETFKEHCRQAETIFWAGPLGYIEWEPTRKHSEEFAQFLASLNSYRAVGGGETGYVLTIAGVQDRFDFVATGGGAALKYLSGEKLPGLLALEQ